MLFKKGELASLWPFYLSFLVFGLTAMVMAFMIIYFRGLGFSFFQISIFSAGFGIAMFLFEIPTGAFADRYSRKYSVIAGFLITGVSVSLIPSQTGFFPILLLWMLAGIGLTFVSGAEEAWVIDNLNVRNQKGLQREFFIKAQSIGAFGLVFAPLLGAFLVNAYSIAVLWYILGLGFILGAIILLLFAQEAAKPKRIGFQKALKETFANSKTALRFTFSHKVVFLLVLSTMFIALMGIGSIGWQPFFVGLSLPTYALGIVYSIVALAMIIFPFLSRLFVRMKVKHALSLTIMIRVALLFSLLLLYPPLYLFAVIIFILDTGLQSVGDPLLGPYFHAFVPDKIRATVVSAKNMLVSAVIAIISLAPGVLMDMFGPQKVLALGGLFGIFAIITYQKIKE